MLVARLIVATRGLAAALALSCAAPCAADDELPESVARAFLEAEAKNYVKVWLDAHPPVAGVTSFGAKTLFVLGLLMAADDYRRSDTDKQKFHAVANGAVAFVAYSYAATPVVGLIVTGVWACAQIVESSVTGSYGEAMLAIQKDIIRIEQQREELVFKSSLSRAYRILVLVDGVRDLMDRNIELEAYFTADCAQRAGDYDRLASCMEMLSRIVSQREGLVRALDGLLALPDADLSLLGEVADPGQAAPKGLRERLQDARAKAQTETDKVNAVYTPMSRNFAKLAAAYMESEAIEEDQRLSAVTAVEASCRARRTLMSNQAVANIADLARVSRQLKNDTPRELLLTQSREIRSASADLIADHAQISLACPIIAKDQRTKRLIALLRQAAARPIS
ncbi:hypothetical protein [Sphingomonas colocasiae]|uniref:Uncharacterized protein n=1 Tax=Sphingomonas colocasiae TaxID=1848973 RepID=A0ABS7PW92_9SPHN|nr:hypothetical protein [Sphingomonas colocasiae]MBY8825538.1 hypothetical protein [Sphingomonas colocasiae]